MFTGTVLICVRKETLSFVVTDCCQKVAAFVPKILSSLENVTYCNHRLSLVTIDNQNYYLCRHRGENPLYLKV